MSGPFIPVADKNIFEFVGLRDLFALRRSYLPPQYAAYIRFSGASIISIAMCATCATTIDCGDALDRSRTPNEIHLFSHGRPRTWRCGDDTKCPRTTAEHARGGRAEGSEPLRKLPRSTWHQYFARISGPCRAT